MERISDMEWCINRENYMSNKIVLHGLEYDDIVEVLGIPSRICKMIDKNTSILSGVMISSFEANRRYHIEWHVKYKNRYLMIMGWNVDSRTKSWVVYYPSESFDIVDEVLIELQEK